MNVRTCYRCGVREGCELKAEKLKQLRGLGLTSVLWKCEVRGAGLHPGRRVEATIGGAGGYDPEDGPISAKRTGTVLGSSRKDSRRVVVVLDEPVGRNRRFVRLWPETLAFINEAPEKLCEHCNAPARLVSAEHWEGCPVWVDGLDKGGPGHADS